MKKYPKPKETKVYDLKDLLSVGAEKYRNKDYLIYKDKISGNKISVSFLQMQNLVNYIGSEFFYLGIKNTTVAVIGETSPQWIATYLAVVNGGNVIVPLDKELAHDELKKFLEKSNVECVVFSSSFRPFFEEVSKENEKIKFYFEIGESEGKKKIEEGFSSLVDVISCGRRLVERGYYEYIDYEIDIDKVCAILFTSGTTGTSKGVMLTQKNITSSVNAAYQMIDVAKEDVLVSVLPVHHTYEMTCGILTPILIGCTVCISEGLKYVVRNFQEYKPTFLVLVPMFVSTIYKKIWDTASKKGVDKKLKTGIRVSKVLRSVRIDLRKQFFKEVNDAFGGRLRKIVCGGAALSGELMTAFDDLGINVVQGYGITECSPLVSVCPFNWKKPGSAGLAVPGVEIKIEKEYSFEETGEVVVRGDNIMAGYFGDEKATRDVLSPDGWFKTGDIGYIDDDGFLFLTGRKKNVIVLDNGKNVFPEELEEHLGKIDTIKECAVVGKKNADGETVVTAIVFPDYATLKSKYNITDAKAAGDEIKAMVTELNKSLPTFKQIRNVEMRTAEFEKTTSHKIKRHTIQ